MDQYLFFPFVGQKFLHSTYLRLAFYFAPFAPISSDVDYSTYYNTDCRDQVT